MYDQAKETRTASDRPCIEELCTHPTGIVQKGSVEYKIKVIGKGAYPVRIFVTVNKEVTVLTV